MTVMLRVRIRLLEVTVRSLMDVVPGRWTSLTKFATERERRPARKVALPSPMARRFSVPTILYLDGQSLEQDGCTNRSSPSKSASLVGLSSAFAGRNLMASSGTVKKRVSPSGDRNDTRFITRILLGRMPLPANASERPKGVRCPLGKGDRQIAEPERTGATEVIRHIVMWKLH